MNYDTAIREIPYTNERRIITCAERSNMTSYRVALLLSLSALLLARKLLHSRRHWYHWQVLENDAAATAAITTTTAALMMNENPLLHQAVEERESEKWSTRMRGTRGNLSFSSYTMCARGTCVQDMSRTHLCVQAVDNNAISS